jgi:hypothetical protein
MPRPPPSLARQYPGHAPWDEAWFVEASVGPDRGVWLRFTLGHGPEGPHQAVWALAFDKDRVVARRASLDRIQRPTARAVHVGPHGRLTADGTRGTLDDLSWDLRFHGGWHHHDHVPSRLAATGLTGRQYRSALLDPSLSGTVRVGGATWRLDHAPGVVGHLFGPRSRVRRWAWCHATFDDGSVFEGLSARLGAGGMVLPPATSLVVLRGTRRLAFTRTRDLFRIRSRTHGDTWEATARRGATVLRVRAVLPPPERVARLVYDHADGGLIGVRNSPLSRVELTLEDTRTGHRSLAITDRGRLELARADDPPAEAHLRG